MSAGGDLAVVSGASGTLGRAVVAALAARGDRVVALARTGEVPEFRQGPVRTVRVETVDFRSPDQVEALWERLDKHGESPRWVVNTVGGYHAGTLVATSREEFTRVLDLNLTTTWESCRAAGARLPAGGAIVNVASRAAVGGSAGAAAYAISKAAVVRLTQVLAAELTEGCVRVNVVLPALIGAEGDRAASVRGAPRRHRRSHRLLVQ